MTPFDLIIWAVACSAAVLIVGLCIAVVITVIRSIPTKEKK